MMKVGVNIFQSSSLFCVLLENEAKARALLENESKAL